MLCYNARKCPEANHNDFIPTISSCNITVSKEEIQKRNTGFLLKGNDLFQTEVQHVMLKQLLSGAPLVRLYSCVGQR